MSDSPAEYIRELEGRVRVLEREKHDLLELVEEQRKRIAELHETLELED